MDFAQYDDVVKIVVIGNSGVGKTHITSLFAKNLKPNKLMPTVGIDFYSKLINLNDNKKVKVQIWDTAGQQQYRSLTINQFKKALGAFIVFDLTNRKSFNDVSTWINTTRERADQNVQIILVGNKSDLLDQRVIKKEEIDQLKRSLDINLYVETSVNEQQTIEDAFKILVTEIDQAKRTNPSGMNQKVKNVELNDGKSTGPASEGCKC